MLVLNIQSSACISAPVDVLNIQTPRSTQGDGAPEAPVHNHMRVTHDYAHSSLVLRLPVEAYGSEYLVQVLLHLLLMRPLTSPLMGPL